jgi:hypothetical protein
MSKFQIYPLGVVGLGLAYQWPGASLSGAASLGIARCYVLLERIAARRWGTWPIHSTRDCSQRPPQVLTQIPRIRQSHMQPHQPPFVRLYL